MSTGSPAFWCGESVGCGTTTDESDEDSASKEMQLSIAKKLKVDVACKRMSKRLQSITQKHVKDSANGSCSHSSQKNNTNKTKWFKSKIRWF